MVSSTDITEPLARIRAQRQLNWCDEKGPCILLTHQRFWSSSHTHTNTHTHANTRTHARTHTHTHTHTRTHTHRGQGLGPDDTKSKTAFTQKKNWCLRRGAERSIQLPLPEQTLQKWNVIFKSVFWWEHNPMKIRMVGVLCSTGRCFYRVLALTALEGDVSTQSLF